MAMQVLTRGRGMATMLLGALLLAFLTTEKSLPFDVEAKATTLPSDLATIPNDSMVLFSLRVADLWNADFLKSVRGKHKDIEQEAQELAKELEKRVGLSVEQVERLTVAVVGPPPASREPVMFVRSIKPYDRAKMLAAGGKPKLEKYKGESLYVADKWAIYLPDDRSLVYSDFPSELRNLIDHPRPKERGALTDALDQAAQKHTMVFGVNLKEYRDRGGLNRLPDGAESFRALSLAHWATLVADIGADSRLAATMHFTDESDAKDRAKTAQMGMDLLRSSLDGGIQALGKQKEMVDLVSLLKQLQEPLKATQIEREGETLRSSIRVRIELPALSPVLVQRILTKRETAKGIENAANLHNLAFAMQNYSDAMRGELPAHAIYSKDGKPLLSWRVVLLPYLDQQALYNEFHLNEPWDSEHNKKLLAKMPKTFASPADEKTVKEHTTFYQGLVGKGAFFEGKQGIRFPADITDGTANTIMIVEASKAVPWTKPEDIPYDPEKPLPRLGLPGASGFLAAMCDGDIHTFSHKITKETLRNAITRNDGNPLGPDF